MMRTVPSAQNLVAYFIVSTASEKREGFGALARICVRAAACTLSRLVTGTLNLNNTA